MIAVDFVGAAIGLAILAAATMLVGESIRAWARDRRGDYQPGDATMMGAIGLFALAWGLGVGILVYALFFR